MKYYPRLGCYKASNVYYNPSKEIATSYDWWVFFKRINGILYFNTYKYSITTQRHQRKVRAILDAAGIQYTELNTKLSLVDPRVLELIYPELFNNVVS